MRQSATDRLLGKCLHCGKPFPKRKGKEFCSPKHKELYNRKENKAKREEKEIDDKLTEQGFPGLIPAVAEFLAPDLTTVEKTMMIPVTEEYAQDFEKSMQAVIDDYTNPPAEQPDPERQVFYELSTDTVIIVEPEEPDDLTGLDLLAWRNEHRKTPE